MLWLLSHPRPPGTSVVRSNLWFKPQWVAEDQLALVATMLHCPVGTQARSSLKNDQENERISEQSSVSELRTKPKLHRVSCIMTGFAITINHDVQLIALSIWCTALFIDEFNLSSRWSLMWLSESGPRHPAPQRASLSHFPGEMWSAAWIAAYWQLLEFAA